MAKAKASPKDCVGTYEVEITFTEKCLGTVPKNKQLYKDYIATKAPTKDKAEEEEATVTELAKRSWTGFHFDTFDGKQLPFMYDYVLKGFFKETCAALSRASGNQPDKEEKKAGKKREPLNLSSDVKAYKKVVDGLVFPFPRKIKIDMTDNLEYPNIEEVIVAFTESEMPTPDHQLVRPLRINDTKGERVCLACSDAVPVGSKMKFTVRILGVVSQALLEEWLEYGALRGLGQWRNASWGRFTYTLKKIA